MEYRIIKGMEDPVRVKGFLLAHFYILLAAGLFGCLLILGSVSTCLQAGSITPLMQNSFMAAVMMITAFLVLRQFSSRRKFPSMGKGGETSNVPLHRRLYPGQRGIVLALEETQRMREFALRMERPEETDADPESAEYEDIQHYGNESQEES